MYRQILRTKLKICVLYLVEIQRTSKIKICVLLCSQALKLNLKWNYLISCTWCNFLIVLPSDRSLCSAGRGLGYQDLLPLVDKNTLYFSSKLQNDGERPRRPGVTVNDREGVESNTKPEWCELQEKSTNSNLILFVCKKYKVEEIVI